MIPTAANTTDLPAPRSALRLRLGPKDRAELRRLGKACNTAPGVLFQVAMAETLRWLEVFYVPFIQARQAELAAHLHKRLTRPPTKATKAARSPRP